MMKKKHSRGQRGLIEADLVHASLLEVERNGLEGFGLRCAARAIGCDVATLSYRFGSKEGLERAIADRLHEEVSPPELQVKWQARLQAMAKSYRQVAKRYPNAFPLLLRFWTTGPRDLQIAEAWHQALYDAGLREADIPAVGCATYAAVLGVCAGETGGLLDKPSAEVIKEVEEQTDLPLTKELMPTFATLGEDDVFEAAINILISGIEAQVHANPAPFANHA
ncbi:TetR/AcrR family transcriptional regulator C-terminal domain-containing protein [Hyphomicrobium sp.]|uniref:TetR/AcrR family transcriptional regulator C-terminal domain-containing protein n=1 Tax=Hyphomicrobium sp. TaxID=82 RepID=UPI002D76E08A|nr:TetR/AcrR family transcriptional regulator C-terminal domain-containing protein [Hyphomicrobium sp.]HET6389891.1 TetR/AcrR family transcriptional regulator C-terminal domain-containing protein [Hyphomicrobium sp.]